MVKVRTRWCTALLKFPSWSAAKYSIMLHWTKFLEFAARGWYYVSGGDGNTKTGV